jgi:hypothetical protein
MVQHYYEGLSSTHHSTIQTTKIPKFILPLLRIELTSSTCHYTLQTSTQSWLFRKKTMAEWSRWGLPKYDDGSPSWRRMRIIATTTRVASTASPLLRPLVVFPVNRSPTPSHNASRCSPPPCLLSFLEHTRNEAWLGEWFANICAR